MKRTSLGRALKDIGTPFALKPDFDRLGEKQPERLKAGPNHWDQVKDDSSKFGPEEDYNLVQHGEYTIFWPVSEAALQWCYAKLPEDCPRFADKGFKIENRYVATIQAAMDRDRLMSRLQYEKAMNEADAIQHQWGDRDGTE